MALTTIRGGAMTEIDRSPESARDPNESPFVTPAVEGMPFERGGEEDAAIDRVLEKSAAQSDDT
jgi:hypothetical protein